MQLLQFYYSRDRVKNAALIRFLSVPAPYPRASSPEMRQIDAKQRPVAF